LRQKTKLNIVVDTFVLQSMGIGFQDNPAPLLLKSNDGKVRTALQNMLNQYHLSYVILGDSVLITSEEVGYLRQMRQRVNVNVKDLTLATALEQLADETGANLLIDPRQADKAKSKITVRLDDVTLETAVRLLTELADLGSARVGNVLYVTTDARAEKLRKEAQGAMPMSPTVYATPAFGGMPNFGGGFALPPVGGRIGGGAIGGGAIGGFGGQPVPPIAVIDPPPPPVAEKKEGKESMTVEEAGRKGGEKVAQERGREFYEEIGHKGGEKVAQERGPEFYKENGQKGGEKVAQERGREFYEEIGRKGGEKVAKERGSEFYEEIGHKGGEKVRELIEKGKETKE